MGTEQQPNKKLNILLAVGVLFPIDNSVSSIVDKTAVMLSQNANVFVVCKQSRNYAFLKRPYKILSFQKSFQEEKFCSDIANTPIDIIHCHTQDKLFHWCKKLAKARNIPLVTTIHQECFANGIRHKVHTANKAGFIWLDSHFAYRFLTRFSLQNSVQVLRNATDFVTDENLPSKRAQKKLLNIKPDTFVYTYVGRIDKNKNLDLLVDAINIIRDSIPNYIVNLVGDGNYKKQLQKRIAKLKLTPNFEFVSSIQDKALLSSYYNASDVILLPSEAEEYPLIPVDAATFRVPTLVLENTAAAELIKDKVNGFTAQNDADDFSAVMKNIYKDMADLADVGELAYQILYRSYHSKEVGDEFIQNYFSCIKIYQQKKSK